PIRVDHIRGVAVSRIAVSRVVVAYVAVRCDRRAKSIRWSRGVRGTAHHDGALAHDWRRDVRAGWGYHHRVGLDIRVYIDGLRGRAGGAEANRADYCQAGNRELAHSCRHSATPLLLVATLRKTCSRM